MRYWLPLAAVLLLAGCQGAATTLTADVVPAPTTAPDAALSAVLPELAKGHSDKGKLATYATSLLRHLDAPVEKFATDMGTEHRRLLGELQGWAKAHGYDLAFHYATDATGRARQSQEKEQGDQLLFDGGADFQRDMLVLMYNDYDWQLNLIDATLPAVHDPALKAYLEDSKKIHKAGLAQIRALLTHYHWKP